MNDLARVVHELVTGEEGAGAPARLSRLEQAALADLQRLLRLSPRDLAALVNERQGQREWMRPSPVGKQAHS